MTGSPVFSTFGCRLNAFETETMRRLAEDSGLGDAVVVNTCAVTAEAVRSSKQAIRRLRRENPAALVVATGCAAQTEPEGFSAMPEVDHVIGNPEKMRAETWRRLAGAPGACERIRVGDVMQERHLPVRAVDGFGARSRAYLQVQNGCDHRCTFCIIPYGRGNSRSVAADAVVDQVARFVDRGYREVVLTGVDLTAWGADLPGCRRLGDLVQLVLDRVPGLPRLRLSSIDSVEADPALLDAMASEARFMPHLHLSLQSGDDMILKRMKRRHNRDDAVRFCEDVRRIRPGVVFGADIIAGFPTESDAMFENSMSLVEECGLTWLHVFPFSPRRGTPAARMPQVDRRIVKDRARRLRDLGDRQARAYLDAQVGGRQPVLVETRGTGRTEGFAEVVLDAEAVPGEVIEARIIGRDGRRLRASAAAPLPGARAAAA